MTSFCCPGATRSTKIPSFHSTTSPDYLNFWSYPVFSATKSDAKDTVAIDPFKGFVEGFVMSGAVRGIAGLIA